jgi:Ca2+-transporting ATPase
MTGEEVLVLTPEALQQKVETVQVFARMLPEAKLKVVEAIKQNGHIVAMTGDGINDGPVLKVADIGIALGKKGTEVARRSADLVLTHDDLQMVVEAIRQGRKTFNNFIKAVRYIISIHIPIILTASLPVLLGWKYPNIFTPVHVIFLELMMGPTCSVFFEREPMETSVMNAPPMEKKTGLLGVKEIALSLLQGIAISFAVLAIYQYFMDQSYSLEYTRTLVFSTLILSNVLLTFVNRSFTETICVTASYRNNLAGVVLILSGSFLLFILKTSLGQRVFGLTHVTLLHLFLCLGVAGGAVFWFELYKAFRKMWMRPDVGFAPSGK